MRIELLDESNGDIYLGEQQLMYNVTDEKYHATFNATDFSAKLRIETIIVDDVKADHEHGLEFSHIVRVTDTPDDTSKLDCDYGSVTSGKSLDCLISAKKDDQNIFASMKSLNVYVDRLFVTSCDTSNMVRINEDDVYNTQIICPIAVDEGLVIDDTNNQFGLQLQVDEGDGYASAGRKININVHQAPNATHTYMYCPSPTWIGDSAIFCDIYAKDKDDNDMDVLLMSFEGSVVDGSGTIEYIEDSNGERELDVINNHFRMAYKASTIGGNSGYVTVSNGVSADQVILVVENPDTTSEIECDLNVKVEDYASCTIFPKALNNEIVTKATTIKIVVHDYIPFHYETDVNSEWNINGTEMSVVLDTINDEEYGTEMKVDLQAPSTTGEFYVALYIPSDDYRLVGYQKILVTDTPDETSYMICTSSKIIANHPFKCQIYPMKNNTSIYANADDFNDISITERTY